jgi:GNAT superfamily N-acetyltransferase
MRPNPFQRRATVPSGYTTSPLTFVRGTSMEYIVDPEERGRAAPGVGIYHVTTNLPAVLAEGRLRSRAELRKGGVASAGLGGGFRDEAAHLISTGMTLDGSLRVMRAVRVMADAVHGRIDSRSALYEFQKTLEPTVGPIHAATDWMLEDEYQESPAYRAADRYEETNGLLMQDVLAAKPGPDLYTALANFEENIASTFVEWVSESWIDDEVSCAMPVGFTEPAHKFERVLPENVGMVQLAARRGASADRVPGECELRFRPEDLTIVAVWASEPTPRVRRQKRNPVAAPDSAAFRRWFGASKVVNARGEPRVMYHGTHADFEVFDTSGTQRARSFGAMFTPSKAYAANYGRKEYGGKVLAVYLRIENPFDAKNKKHEREWEAKRLPQEGWVQYAHRAGYDGAITMLNEYVVFDPRQVKSATANVGTFDPEDPSILRNPAKAPKAPRTFRDLGAWTDWARTQGVTLRLARAGYGPVEVTDLYADVVGTGAGSRVMEALVAAADQQGMPLRLTPSGKRNITFYERFGFTVGRSAHDTAMHRTPRRR